MTNEEICVWLKAEAEPKFQRFTSGLIPGTDPIIGVRIPKLRTLAKRLQKRTGAGIWNTLPAILMRRSCCRDSYSDMQRRD